MLLHATMEIKDDKFLEEELRNVIRSKLSKIMDEESRNIIVELLERKKKDGKIEDLLSIEIKKWIRNFEKPSLDVVIEKIIREEILPNIKLQVTSAVLHEFEKYDKTLETRIGKKIKEFFSKMNT